MRKDFYRCTLKQLALLLLVLGILLGFVSRYVHEERAARVAFQKLQRNENDLRVAINSNNVVLARDAIERGARPTDGRWEPMLTREVFEETQRCQPHCATGKPKKGTKSYAS